MDWRGTGIYPPPPALSRLELKLFPKTFIYVLFILFMKEYAIFLQWIRDFGVLYKEGFLELVWAELFI